MDNHLNASKTLPETTNVPHITQEKPAWFRILESIHHLPLFDFIPAHDDNPLRAVRQQSADEGRPQAPSPSGDCDPSQARSHETPVGGMTWSVGSCWASSAAVTSAVTSASVWAQET